MLLEDIYKGKIFPQESIKSETKQYKELSKQRIDLYDQLIAFLPVKKAELLDEYTEVMFGMGEEHSTAAFVEGAKFGITLIEETK